MLYNHKASRRWKRSRGEGRRVGRVAEGGGLLNRCRTKSSTGGSNPPLSASKTNYFRMCNLAANNKPGLAAKSGFRLSPENLCRERREAKPTPVYPSGERSLNVAFLKCSTGISIQDRKERATQMSGVGILCVPPRLLAFAAACDLRVDSTENVDFLPVRKGMSSRIRASFTSARPLPSRISRASPDSILRSSAPETRIEGDFTRPGRVLRMYGWIVFPSKRDRCFAWFSGE